MTSTGSAARIIERDALDLARAFREGELTAVEILEAHLDQIDLHNAAVNAIVTLDAPGARAHARSTDAARAKGEPLGPLSGLPIAIKDTHDTAGMRTTYGALSHRDNVPDADREHVTRIRRAGATVIGKTNVPEYAAGSHTVNRVFGPTRNPYDLRLSVGGSSGGSAAALASRFVPLADGGDMGGSLRNPASFCNVVGLRPTPGTVSPLEPSNLFSPLTTAGPMARSVADVGLLLSVMTGAPVGGVGFEELRGLRVAWAPTLGGRVPVEAGVLEVLARQVALLEDAGADIEEACPDLDGADEVFRTLRAAEFAAEWEADLADDPDDFPAQLAQNIREGFALSATDVVRAEREMSRLIRSAAEFFETYDVVLAPVAQVPPFPVEVVYPTDVDGARQRDYLDWMRAAYLFTPLGLPGLSLPAGFTPRGEPIGLQLLTARHTDGRLLRIAHTIEAATGFARILPRFDLRP